ncbi:MAG: hypothetical protein HFH03_11535 [Dorea sp.]|nr:hypothetical protein [Dorea sp.]
MKKYVRNLAVISAGIVFACSLSLTGCKAEEQKTEEKKTEIIVESEGQMEGRLVSFEGKTLVVEEAEQDYTFDVSEATVNTKNMRAGDDLVIYFEGKLEDTDTSKVKVTSIEDLGENRHQTEKQAVGTLVKITENTITIRQNDGEKLLFNSNNCQHEFKNGIREGNWVVVTYIGEINGTDTKNVTVIKITDNAPNIVKKEQKKMKIKTVNEKVYTTAGVHIRELYTTESKVISSLAKGESVIRTGVCENGWSRVQYKDKDAYIYGEYLTTEKPKKDAPAAKVSGEEVGTIQIGDEPEPVTLQSEVLGQIEKEMNTEKEMQAKEETLSETHTLTGTVLEVNMNMLTVSEKGKEYTINVADAQHEYANGIQTGNTVTVTYAGNLDNPDDLIVIKVQDSDPNEAAKDAQYVGVVDDTTGNTVTLKTEDGASMTFVKDGAENSLDEDMDGKKIKVTADMTESETDENIFQAKQIDSAEGEQ